MDNSAAIAEEFKQYAYSVSHDVGAPARAMIEFSRLLSSEYGNRFDGDAKEYLGLIIENGRKLQAMMDALLLYSRISSRKFSFSPVPMHRLLLDCCARLKPLLSAADALVDIGEMPQAYGSEELLRQLVDALLVNALTYRMPEKIPEIRITASRIPGFWRISISDNGIGIPQDRRTVIFDLFRRLHTEEEYPGIGMGLTLARKIVERHGGIIGCEGLPQGGSTFYFTLPLCEVSP